MKRFEEAISALQEAAHIFRDTSDRDREGLTRTNLEAARKARLDASQS
jgi:hypothetical protein